jgi:hypothetical protein
MLVLKLCRWLVGLGVVGCVGLGGCGGGGGVAVRVGSRSLSVAAVEHWMPIEAVLSYEPIPKGPVAKGVIPDPPDYRACVAQLHALDFSSKIGEVAKPGRAALKKQCERRYKTVRENIITILITDLWLRGEAAAHGITVSESEARRELEHNKPLSFPNEAAFRDYLKWTGLTMADEMLLYEKNLLSLKVLRKVIQRPGLSKDQQKQAYVGFITRWVSKTSCQPGYIVPDCKQYKGPLPAGQ